jgi:hypothetical protein
VRTTREKFRPPNPRRIFVVRISVSLVSQLWLWIGDLMCFGTFLDPQNEEKAGLENDLRLRSRYMQYMSAKERERHTHTHDGNQYPEYLVTLHFLSSFFLWNLSLSLSLSLNIYIYIYIFQD